MRIHYIQHAAAETPGVILDWAAENGHTLSATFTYGSKAETAFPPPDSFDWLVIMGGAMNVYEDAAYPWLTEEKAFIKKAVEADKTVLGLCLGAQLLAASLGGKVTKNAEKEIGWFPVTLGAEALSLPYFALLPKAPLVFQWHGDTFSTLPPGAVRLATGDVCENQAFMYGERVFAFQFHWENTRETIKEFIASGADELAAGGAYIQKPEEMLVPEYIQQSNAWMRAFLSRLAGARHASKLAAAGAPLLFAVASKDGTLVDQHFGHAQKFYIYEYDGGVTFKECRNVPQYCAPGEREKTDTMDAILKTIGDCVCVLCLRIGEPPRRILAARGIKAIMAYNSIEEAVKEAAQSLSG
jgi:GMP synthase-like glutamine amidotransferase/predicted Fe-Mo cluster-binding NifX family protein